MKKIDWKISKDWCRMEGLSSETKPTQGHDEGSQFHETDTGNLFRWDGRVWVADGVASNAILQNNQVTETHILLISLATAQVI